MECLILITILQEVFIISVLIGKLKLLKELKEKEFEIKEKDVKLYILRNAHRKDFTKEELKQFIEILEEELEETEKTV